MPITKNGHFPKNSHLKIGHVTYCTFYQNGHFKQTKNILPDLPKMQIFVNSTVLPKMANQRKMEFLPKWPIIHIKVGGLMAG